MTDDIEEILKKKITISQFIKPNPKGAIIGIRNCDIPTFEEKTPSEHFTFNAEKLSFHKTSNKTKNDTRTDSERHSDEISIMDLLEVVEKKQTELQAAIDEQDYETILSMLQDFFSLFTEGDRPLMDGNDIFDFPPEQIELLKSLPPDIFKDIDGEDIFNVESSEPTKKGANITMTLDSEKLMKYIYQLMMKIYSGIEYEDFLKMMKDEDAQKQSSD